jgi:hypothetical protein
VLRVDTVTLTGLAPGQQFSITEAFDFTQDRGTFPFAPQGNVGATVMTDPAGRTGTCTGPDRRCWPFWLDLRERWLSRLVATAAAVGHTSWPTTILYRRVSTVPTIARPPPRTKSTKAVSGRAAN